MSSAKVLPSSSSKSAETSSKEKRLPSALSSKRKEDSQRSQSKSEKPKKAAKSEKSARSTATTKSSRSTRSSKSSTGGLTVLGPQNRTAVVPVEKLRRHSPRLYGLYNKGSRSLDVTRYDPTAVGMFTSFLNGDKEHVRGSVSFRAASDLLELAARMDVLSLRTQLEQQLISSAKKNEKAAIQALAIAGRGFGSPRLLRELTSTAAPKFGQMVHEVTFVELPVHVLALLLERCDLAVASELEVADAVLLWLSARRRPSHSAGILFAQLRGAALHPVQQIEIVERARALRINIKTVQYLAAHLSQRGSCSQHVTAKHVRCVRLPSNAPPPAAKGLPLSTPHSAMACLEEEARGSRSASFLPSVSSQRSTRSSRSSRSRRSEKPSKSKKGAVLEKPGERSNKSQKSGKAVNNKKAEKSQKGSEKSTSRRRPKSQGSQKSAKQPPQPKAPGKKSKSKSKRSLKESTKALKKKLSFSKKGKRDKSKKSFKSAKSDKSTKSDKSGASQKSQKSKKISVA